MTNEEYMNKINEIEGIMVLDPLPESPEGQRLLALVAEVEAYEQETYKELGITGENGAL